MADKLKTGTETLRGGIETLTTGIQNLTDFALSPLFTTVDALDTAITAIQQGINDVKTGPILDVRALSGQIQNLIQLPAWANTDLDSRLSIYRDLTESYLELLPGRSNSPTPETASDDEKINAALMVELAASAALVGVSIIARSALNLQTRSQVLTAASDIADLYATITAGLEEVQELTAGNPLDSQYFSLLSTYPDAALLTANAIRLLLIAAFDLSVERRFSLDRPRAPIEITISEYGELGELDYLFDLFITTNNLKGDEILLLPAGREVVVYG
jgi:hypothetical protein